MAANKQASAQTNAANQQYQMFNTINQQEQPFIQAGQGALGQINAGLQSGGQFNSNFTAQDYLNNQDPGYQFQLQTGGQAIRNADTPTQGALSGSALKDLMGFNQGMAATGYQNAFNRYQTNTNNIFQRLQGIATLGQNAATQTGSQGVQLAGNAGAATAAAGASSAAGIVGATNAIGNSSVPLGYLMNQQNSNNNAAANTATDGQYAGNDWLTS
jgi:hypothetical protein